MFVAAIIMGAVPAFGQEKNGKGVLDATALACMQIAVNNRDNTIIAALDVYYPAAKTALQTRQAALKVAWMQTDQKVRRKTIKTIWETYKNSVKSARAAMKEAQKAAWTKFEADRKACSPKAGGDDKGGLGADNQL